jgi:hypothetical protein
MNNKHTLEDDLPTFHDESIQQEELRWRLLVEESEEALEYRDYVHKCYMTELKKRSLEALQHK